MDLFETLLSRARGPKPKADDPAFKRVPRTYAGPKDSLAINLVQAVADTVDPKYEPQDVHLPKEGKQPDPRILERTLMGRNR